MSRLSGILETAKRALMAQRFGIGVTSHNIANASNPGFSRQRVSMETHIPQLTSAGMIGTGVKVSEVMRMRNGFIDKQIRMANHSYGEASTRKNILSQVESIINEPSETGLNSVLEMFFNSFQELSANPEDSAARNSVLHKGIQLAQSFNHLHNGLNTMKNDLIVDVNMKVNRINEITEQVASLNYEIVQAQAGGHQANDAKDARDVLLDELSQLANVSFSEGPQGAVSVFLNGTQIASESSSVDLEASVINDQITIKSSVSGKALNITGGEIGGLMKMHNNQIPGYIETINSIAEVVINRVNEVHSSGYGLGDPPPTGINFFTGSSAGDIAVNTDIQNNVELIAASSDGAPGNNEIALALAGIADEKLFGNGTQTISQKYGSFVSSIGFQINSAEGSAKSQELVLSQLDLQKSSVSGVSLDEEMANLIQYQRAFDAAARVIRSVDEMFDTILRMV